ncbi:MAG: hypothetical protein EZS28_002034 [Streblomastix strix]|uniref:Uncharacterized protein n=1 Tax=Streblomastix strix TaxID=222440 RepID=A0A5J4X7B6_9EUKA|nr:MAG: hypothetical protein EZS28_002034 [Streblomastix strix]
MEYTFEEEDTLSTWQLTQRIDIQELRYMVQILRSDNEVMQARCIRRMISLICKAIRQGDCEEIISVVKEESLRQMLRARVRYSRRELRMIRDVLTNIIDAFPSQEEFIIEENVVAEVEPLLPLDNSGNLSSNENEFTTSDEENKELAEELDLLRQAIDEGKKHMWKKGQQDMKDRPQKQNGTRLSRSRRSRRSSASDSMVNVSDEENNVPYQIEANE